MAPETLDYPGKSGQRWLLCGALLLPRLSLEDPGTCCPLSGDSTITIVD